MFAPFSFTDESIVQMLGINLLAIIVHELTHVFYTIATGDFIKLTFTSGCLVTHFNPKMNPWHKRNMYLSAIFTGLIVILAAIWYTEDHVHIISLLIYLYGCKYDFQAIIYGEPTKSTNRHNTIRGSNNSHDI